MISIIIVTWNTMRITSRCIDSIRRNVRGTEYEIILVDNGSTDGSQEVFQKLEYIRLIRNDQNLGFAKANNQGIRAAKGDVLLLLNSDTLIIGDSVEKSIEYLRANPRMAIVGCRLLNEDGSLQRSCSHFPGLLTPILGKQWLGRIRQRTFGVHSTRFDSAYSDADHDRLLYPDWIMGAFMMVKRAAVDEVGLLDEEYFMYHEDIDWCRRFRKSGWEIGYYPDAAIVHLGNASGNIVRRDTIERNVRSMMLYFRKHHGPLSAKLFALVSAVALGAEILVRMVVAPLRDGTEFEIVRNRIYKFAVWGRYILHLDQDP